MISYRYKTTTTVFIAMTVLLLLKCAPSMSPSFPRVDGELAVKVSPEQPSSLTDTPSGSHKVENTQFVLFQRRDVTKPHAGAVLEIIFDGTSPRGRSKALMEEVEDILHMDLVRMTQDALRAVSNSAKRPPPWNLEASTGVVNTLEIKPYVFISPDRKSRARIWIFLKTSMKNEKGSGIWGARYIYYVPDERQMFGEGGWFEQDGALLRAAVKEGLEQAILVMTEDASRAEYGWGREQVTLSTRFAGTDHVTAVKGWILKKDAEKIIFSPKIRGHYSGVNIIPSSEAVIRGAK